MGDRANLIYVIIVFRIPPFLVCNNYKVFVDSKSTNINIKTRK